MQETSSITTNSPSVAFVMLAYGERKEILRVWKEVRAVYKHAPIIVRFDGEFKDKQALAPMRADSRVKVLEEPELFPLENGGFICQRLLELFLETDADVFIKIDPDTQIRRPIKWLPPRDAEYFGGSIQECRKGGVQSVQGGCIILSRQTASRLFDSKLLESRDLKPPECAWIDRDASRFRAYFLGMASVDFCLGWALAKLGVSASQHSEIMSAWIAHRLSSFRRYYSSAVVHPKLSCLSIFTPYNMMRRLRLKTGLSLQDWTPPTGRSTYCLNFSDFDKFNIPPAAIAWIVANCDRGSHILELGSGRSTRELSKLYSVTSIEENEEFTSLENVNYVVAPFKDDWYEIDAVEMTLDYGNFDCVIVDGPYAGEQGRSFSRLGFQKHFGKIKNSPHIIVDDVERPLDLLNMLLLYRQCKSCRLVDFFFFANKACCAIHGSSRMTFGHWLVRLPALLRLLILCLKHIRRNRRAFFADMRTLSRKTDLIRQQN